MDKAIRSFLGAALAVLALVSVPSLAQNTITPDILQNVEWTYNVPQNFPGGIRLFTAADCSDSANDCIAGDACLDTLGGAGNAQFFVCDPTLDGGAGDFVAPTNIGGGGGGSPGAPNDSVQFRVNSTTFGGDVDFLWDDTLNKLTVNLLESVLASGSGIDSFENRWVNDTDFQPFTVATAPEDYWVVTNDMTLPNAAAMIGDGIEAVAEGTIQSLLSVGATFKVDYGWANASGAGGVSPLSNSLTSWLADTVIEIESTDIPASPPGAEHICFHVDQSVVGVSHGNFGFVGSYDKNTTIGSVTRGWQILACIPEADFRSNGQFYLHSRGLVPDPDEPNETGPLPVLAFDGLGRLGVCDNTLDGGCFKGTLERNLLWWTEDVPKFSPDGGTTVHDLVLTQTLPFQWPQFDGTRTIVVDSSGFGDYLTIQEAIDEIVLAGDCDEDTPYNVLVMARDAEYATDIDISSVCWTTFQSIGGRAKVATFPSSAQAPCNTIGTRCDEVTIKGFQIDGVSAIGGCSAGVAFYHNFRFEDNLMKFAFCLAGSDDVTDWNSATFVNNYLPNSNRIVTLVTNGFETGISLHLTGNRIESDLCFTDGMFMKQDGAGNAENHLVSDVTIVGNTAICGMPGITQAGSSGVKQGFKFISIERGGGNTLIDGNQFTMILNDDTNYCAGSPTAGCNHAFVGQEDEVGNTTPSRIVVTNNIFRALINGVTRADDTLAFVGVSNITGNAPASQQNQTWYVANNLFIKDEINAGDLPDANTFDFFFADTLDANNTLYHNQHMDWGYGREGAEVIAIKPWQTFQSNDALVAGDRGKFRMGETGEGFFWFTAAEHEAMDLDTAQSKTGVLTLQHSVDADALILDNDTSLNYPKIRFEGSNAANPSFIGGSSLTNSLTFLSSDGTTVRHQFSNVASAGAADYTINSGDVNLAIGGVHVLTAGEGVVNSGGDLLLDAAGNVTTADPLVLTAAEDGLVVATTINGNHTGILLDATGGVTHPRITSRGSTGTEWHIGGLSGVIHFINDTDALKATLIMNGGAGANSFTILDGNLHLAVAGASVANTGGDLVLDANGSVTTADQVEITFAGGSAPPLTINSSSAAPHDGLLIENAGGIVHPNIRIAHTGANDVVIMGINGALSIGSTGAVAKHLLASNAAAGLNNLTLVDGNIILSFANAEVDGVDVSAHIHDGIDGSSLHDLDTHTGETDWGSAITKTVFNLTIDGVNVDYEAGAAEGFPRLAQNTVTPGGACDIAGEQGRLYMDTDASVNEKLFICTGAGGWERVGGAGGGGFTSFFIDGDNTAPQTITDGNTALFVGGTGITTVAAVTDQVTFNLTDMAANTIKGNDTGSAGVPVDIAVGTNTVLGRVAGNIVAGQVQTGQMAINSVTNLVLNNMSGFSVKARTATGAGDPADFVLGTNTVLGRVAGDIIAAQLATAQVADDAITYAKMQNVVANNVFLGNNAGAGAIVDELTGTEATAMLNNFTAALAGLAPLSGGGTTNFLRADGTWVAPAGGGGTDVEVDTGGALASADFQDGGDINFAEAAGIVTATVKTDTIATDELLLSIAPTWTGAHIWSSAGTQVFNDPVTFNEDITIGDANTLDITHTSASGIAIDITTTSGNPPRIRMDGPAAGNAVSWFVTDSSGILRFLDNGSATIADFLINASPGGRDFQLFDGSLLLDNTDDAPQFIEIQEGSVGGDLFIRHTVPGDIAVSKTFTWYEGTTVGLVHENGSGVLSSSLLVNADVDASAAIAGSKLATEVVLDTEAPGGQLANTYASPNVIGIRTTTGPTNLTIGAIADTECLQRSGSTVIGTSCGGGGPATDIATSDTTLTTRGNVRISATGQGLFYFDTAERQVADLTQAQSFITGAKTFGDGILTVGADGWTNAQHDHSDANSGGAVPEASVTFSGSGHDHVGATAGNQIGLGGYDSKSIDGDDILTAIGGKWLTMNTGPVPDLLDVDDELGTRVKTFNLFDPVTGDSGLIQWAPATAITITKVWCSTAPATATVTIMPDERAEATPNTGGTDILSSGLVCDDNSQTGTISNSTIDAYDPINFDIDATGGATATVVRVHIEFDVNDI